jgi:AraC-like DNA-binding protein
MSDSRPLSDYAEFEFDLPVAADAEGMLVRWGGQEVLTHKIPIETPAIPYVLLKYCVAGTGVLEAADARWEIGPGIIFWTAPRTPSVLTADRDVKMVNLALILAGKGAAAAVEQYLQADASAIGLTNPDPVEATLREIMAEGRGTAEHREEICALLAEVLLRRMHAQATDTSHVNPMARQTFKRCREYIEKHFARLTTLGEVAEACEVTVPYLCRLFDQFHASSPYEYMTKLKMSRAENLLLRPDSPVREIATAVGYKDARLFARNFKTVYGKNPTEYRNEHAAE